MPPRRSSRAASASLEVPPPEPVPAKRKRGQTADAEPDEKEDVTKPASKARRAPSSRSGVALPTKSRSSVRGQTSLPGVAESDNEEQSDAPPSKKARPSVESRVKVEDHEEEVQERPRRTRRVASTKLSTSTADMEVDDDGPSRSSGRRTNQAASLGIRASTESAQTTRANQDQDDEDQDVKPTKSRRGGSKRASSRAIEPDEDEDAVAQLSEEEEEHEMPARKGRKPKAKPLTTRKSKAPSKKIGKVPVEIKESDDSDQELEPPPPAQPQPKPEAPPTAAEEVEPEEEEKSLFDPPPMPAHSTLPQEIPEESTGPKARLVIHKMALVNFKSYAGRQEIGPFHKSFSAIVGPNGSGKSNTIDALLFVFGYRASKMRQGKISELIHISANHPDLEECSVEVHFREIYDLPGPDNFKVIPKSQLVVTRTAYKNNSSRYTINGGASSYSEVQTLLKGRGIDLDHNRFLILQGEVESIAQMKPKAPTEHEDGLLEYLEDIIGTSKYKEPIDEAMVEVERLQEDRQMKMNRLRHVEKEKAALEESKREAEDYIRLKNDYARAQSRYFQWQLW
ncbi:RecF/RecN/SMC N terminal domain-containing protein, partial [Crepidotus variabilis]